MNKTLFLVCLLLLESALARAGDEHAANVEVLAEASSSWDGRALPEYARGTPQITILRITVPPKVRLPLHLHPVINAGVLLEGELTVVTEDEKMLHLKAGDAIVEVVDKLHYGRNDGDEPAQIIVFYAGVEGKPITIKHTGE